jgi:hypothetical protein
MDPSVSIGDLGNTICDTDVEVSWSIDPDGPDGTLTLTASATGCTPTVSGSPQTVSAQQGAGNSSFPLTVSGCANGTKVTIKATLTQGSASVSDTKTTTVSCP